MSVCGFATCAFAYFLKENRPAIAQECVVESRRLFLYRVAESMGVLGDIRVKVLPAKSWWVVRKRIGKTMCQDDRFVEAMLSYLKRTVDNFANPQIRRIVDLKQRNAVITRITRVKKLG